HPLRRRRRRGLSAGGGAGPVAPRAGAYGRGGSTRTVRPQARGVPPDGHRSDGSRSAAVGRRAERRIARRGGSLRGRRDPPAPGPPVAPSSDAGASGASELRSAADSRSISTASREANASTETRISPTYAAPVTIAPEFGPGGCRIR